MEKINKLKILKIEPGEKPYVKEMEDTLEAIQSEVKGFFQCVYLDDNCIAVVNEEGKLNGLELNRRIGYDIIAGPFFICGDNESGEFMSLTDEQIEKYSKEFEDIQTFTGEEPEAQPRIMVLGFDF